MPESMEAVYEAAQDAYLGALNLHLEDGAVRAAVDAVRPLLIAEGRRQAVAAIRERVGDIAAVEWAALIVEEEGRG